ncbi:MAG TPA: PepSY domain-containing protein [Gemmatimonadales bacterium]|nr:PepSY domain-containing protein [Gemmatimonadales bacterium]
MKIAITTLAVLLATRTTPSAAQEKKVTPSQLPAAVRRTADEQSRGAKVLGYETEKENGQTVYEVEMTVGGRSRDVTIDSSGNVLEVEEQVVFDSLPEAVRSGLRAAAGGGQITNVESLTKRGTLVAYEAHVRTGDKRSEIQVGPDGKPLAHPE